jgi:multidrug efflux pump subunit AcrB
MAVLIAVVGVLATQRMSTDIFPETDVPVVSIVWLYSGMPADEIESRIILVNERVLTTAVNDIEHIESQSYTGYRVIRVYFHPKAKVAEAEAQVTATCQTLLKVLPPGITPPYVVRYSATSVPIMQIAVSSDTLTEQQIFDYTANFVIQRLGTVQGARIPQPYGGLQRQVMVDLDPEQLYGRGLSPQDVATAIANQNLIVPAGTAKIGDTEYTVRLNSSPKLIQAFNDIPIRTVNGIPVYVKNVAHVRDGYSVQTNIVRRDGRRAVLLTVLKSEGASTLDVVRGVKAALPGIQAQMPPELKMDILIDQSVFVRSAVDGVLKEGAIAVQTPPYRIDSVETLTNTPIVKPGLAPQFLANLADLRRSTTALNISHYDIQTVYEVNASVAGRDLGGVIANVQKAVDAMKPDLPPAAPSSYAGRGRHDRRDSPGSIQPKNAKSTVTIQSRDLTMKNAG